jgi:hypothetical protein
LNLERALLKDASLKELHFSRSDFGGRRLIAN